MFWIFGGIGVFCTIFLYFNLPKSLGTSKNTTEDISIPQDQLEQTIEELENEKNNEINSSKLPPAQMQA